MRLSNNRGATLVEFGMYTGLISVFTIATAFNVGKSFESTFGSVLNEDRVRVYDSAAYERPTNPPASQRPGPVLEQGLPYGYEAVSLDVAPENVSYASSSEGPAWVDVNFGSYKITSEIFYATMLEDPITVSLEGFSGATMSIAGGPEVTSGIVEPNMSVRFKMAPSSSYSDTRRVIAKTGGETFLTFEATTRPYPDLEPDAFTVQDVTGAEPGALIELSTLKKVTMSGIEVNRAPEETAVGRYTAPVSISGQGDPQVRIAGGAWVREGVIANGETLEVRLRASETYGARHGVTVSVGNQHVVTSVTTRGENIVAQPFGNQNGNLGKFKTTRVDETFAFIAVDPSWSGGFKIKSQPERFAENSLQLKADPANNQISISCYDAKDCRGKYDFRAEIIHVSTGKSAYADFYMHLN